MEIRYILFALASSLNCLLCSSSTCTAKEGATVRKCCPEHQVAVSSPEGELICNLTNSTTNWAPEMKCLSSEGWTTYNGSQLPVHQVTFDCPKGHELFLFEPYLEPEIGKFYLLPSGNLFVPDHGVQHLYCIDFVYGGNDSSSSYFAEICLPTENLPIRYVMFGTLFLLSAIFLLATFFVYSFVPFLQNSHGRLLLGLVGSLMMADILLSAIYFGGPSFANNCYIACVVLGFFAYFFFLASVFWMNIMSLDIWMAIHQMRTRAQDNNYQPFFRAAVVSWGLPLLFSIVAITFQYTPGFPDAWRPGIGEDSCWFKESTILLFLYGPMMTLLSINVLLFVMTTYTLRRVRRISNNLRSRTSGVNKANLQHFLLCIKLFMVMGISWLTEFIAWAVDGPEEYWYILDIWNILQGVFIFVIFVCKKSTLLQLKNTFQRRCYRSQFASRYVLSRSKRFNADKKQENEGQSSTTFTLGCFSSRLRTPTAGDHKEDVDETAV